MSTRFAGLRSQPSKKKASPKTAPPKTAPPKKKKSPKVVPGVPVKNFWDGLFKEPKTILTPADKRENKKDVYCPDQMPDATVDEIPMEGDTPDDNDDGFTPVVKPPRNVNTSRHGQTRRRPQARVRKPKEEKTEKKTILKLPPPKPVWKSHVIPNEVIQPHGESPPEQKRNILPFPVPPMPDRSEFKLGEIGIWSDLAPIKEEEPELPVASMEHIFTMCFKLLTWMLVAIVPVDQEIDDLSTFSREIESLYELACEQDDHENQLKLERLKVCLEKIQVYSGYFLGYLWVSHKTSPPGDQEEAFQHIAVWFYEIISIYQDLTNAYENDGGDIVRTGHEKQSPDLAVNNLLKGGFFTLLPHFLGDENGHLRRVFEDQGLERELLSEKRIAARILLQFVIWILPKKNRDEKAVQLTKFVKKVMSWDDETDSLTHLMGQVFSE